MDARRVDVWSAGIEDRPGGLAEKLRVVSEAGGNLEFVIARREQAKPGTGVVFLSPLKGQRQIRAARKAGFIKTESLHSVRVEGADKPGLGGRVAAALAEAGINLRGLSAAALGRKAVIYLALDSSPDAAKAIRTLKKLS